MTQIISDFHIHSRFSRATSHELTIANLDKWARVKGIDLLGTGDFSHPEWNKELKQELTEDGTGILKTKSGFNFVLSNEISLMYSQDGKGRRVHIVLLAPNFKTVDQITSYLLSKGRIDYDGRPIFNISCDKFVEDIMKISNEIEVIPAHAWTPYFGVFGSMTGFDTMEQAFKEQVKNIHSFETGMSSDPEMNWRLSKLDKFSILSFSDSHSFWPWRLGREATIFDLKDLSYKGILDGIRNNKIDFTIETSPSYGKYHYDGHRVCKFSCSPEESRKINNICPVCGKKLVIGVLNRVEELADRKDGFKPGHAKPFRTLLPLHELIAARFQMGVNTKKVWQEYNSLIEKFKHEFNILLNVSESDLKKVTTENLVRDILKNREGKIKVQPGYDGEYGQLVLESDKQEKLI
ncbi:MAG: endonuclease Q family protein [Candidatus Pacearchaeota archaeon]|nr:endonuclease Q family protein [Candidatus Pacearchaeota archaeon]